MWAPIGIFTGWEDNILWRRSDRGRALEASGVQAPFARDVAELPAAVIHSSTNPLERYTGGILSYGSDCVATTRSRWDPDTLIESPSDGATIRAMFARANLRMRRG